LHSAIRVQAPLAMGLWLLAALVLRFAPIDRWWSLSLIGVQEAYLTILCLGASILLGVPMGVIAGTYRASERLPRAANIDAVKRAAILAGTLGAIALGARPWQVALVQLALNVVGCIWILIDLKRINPWLPLWPSRGSVSLGLSM